LRLFGGDAREIASEPNDRRRYARSGPGIDHLGDERRPLALQLLCCSGVQRALGIRAVAQKLHQPCRSVMVPGLSEPASAEPGRAA
jgi:hypothetical protein